MNKKTGLLINTGFWTNYRFGFIHEKTKGKQIPIASILSKAKLIYENISIYEKSNTFFSLEDGIYEVIISFTDGKYHIDKQFFFCTIESNKITVLKYMLRKEYKSSIFIL